MAPAIASTGQSRSRLPPKWMQQATLKSAAPVTRPTDRAASLQESPIRWSTHTLTAGPNDTVRSRAESTTSTYVDAFAHRRKSRISDLTFVDHLEDPGSTRLTPSESLTSSINDLSLTLNNDDDDRPSSVDLPHQKPPQALQHDRNQDPITDGLDSDQDNSGDDQDMNDDIASRIDRLMAATMEALENSNRLVLDTLSSRAKLAQLNAMEAALDSHLDAREAHLHRQIQAVTDMTAFVSKTTVELQRLTAPTIRLPSGGASTSQLTTLADPAELEVRSAAAAGIVQALDRNATIGKTAVKRLERMLQTPTTPTSSPSSAASSQRRRTDSTRRVFSISNFASVQDSIAEEGQAERDDTNSTPNADSSQDQSDRAAAPTATPTSAANISSDSHTSTLQKKRSTSYDSRASGGMKPMTKLAGPSVASTSGFAPSQSVSTAASIVAGPASLSTVDDDVSALPAKTAVSDTKGSSKTTTIRPSLLAALRQDTASTSSRSSLLSNATPRPTQMQSISGLPSYSAGMGLKATADVGATPTTAELTLAALLGMPSAAASTSPRTETPSDSSYFDSAMQESFSSTSPPTPGSIHVIHGVLATPWKPTDSPDIPSSQERFARRGSMQYSSLVSPRASLSLSDRERANQLSSQLAELRAERVTWNPNSVGSAEAGVAGASTSASGAGGGGALRALQKLNEMSAAKIARHNGTSGEEEGSAWYGGSKRVSLGLGLPSFSALRPSASRSTSTAAVSSAPSPARPTPSTSNEADQDSEAADASSSSLLGGGWRSWASWNAGTPNGDNSRKQK